MEPFSHIATFLRNLAYLFWAIWMLLFVSSCQPEDQSIDVTATPAEGTFDRKVSVVLNASMGGSTIYYRIIDPNLEDVKYEVFSQPIEVNQTSIVEFYASGSVKKRDSTMINETDEQITSAVKQANYFITANDENEVEVVVEVAAEVAVEELVSEAPQLPTAIPTEIPEIVYSINAPVVSASSPTSDLTPTWSWVSGGGDASQTFRYRLNGGSWTQTPDLSYTPSSALAHGIYTLEVQESDLNGVWSNSGSKIVFVYTESVVGNFYENATSNPAAVLVLQSDPPVGSTISLNGTITLYFSDTLDIDTVSSSTFSVTQNAGSGAVPVYGTIIGQLTTTGGSYITFVPFESYSLNASVLISISSGLHSNAGASITGTSLFSYTTSSSAPVVASASSAISFESGESSAAWTFSGNAGVVGTLGVAPSDGSKMVMITTGSVAAVRNVAALSNKTSSFSLTVDVPSGMNKLNFDYDFMSEEKFSGNFNYDDTFTMSISGPSGAVSYLVASVNKVGNTVPGLVSFAGFSNPNYNGPRHTNWQKVDGSDWICPTSGYAFNCSILEPEFDVSALGSPLNITFTVSDVNDSSYSSAVAIDNIRFVP